MAQPHMEELAGALQAAIQREVENVPAPGGMEAIGARLDRLLQQHHQMQDTINLDREEINRRLDLHHEEINRRLDLHREEINRRLDLHREELNRRFDLIPMRIYNRTRGDNDVLDGRDRRIPDEFPNTLNLLRAASRNQCNALADHLDIQFRHRNMTVNERRQEIANFLGVHL
ncbi:hypothetical protein EDD15DRAFT_2315488 [Pisolithus albus]|nr:hypothetical protein EDD15DRAFT_2315488 [Pisolithus albus]